MGADIDMFVHLAAQTNGSRANATGPEVETVAIARNVRDFIAATGIRRVLVLSSIAASIAEKNQKSARRYGLEKLAADKLFIGLQKDKHAVIILRPPAVYGDGMQNSMSVLAALVRKGIPIPLGAAIEPRNYISLRNLANLIETIVGSSDLLWMDKSPQIYEPSDGQGVSTRNLVGMMGGAIGRKPYLLYVPLPLLRLTGNLTGRAELISGAIDRLDVANEMSLKHRFGWRPVEQMPESLAFLARGVTRE